MAGFSFAGHEDDPMDVVKHPGEATAAGIAHGAMKGTALGAGLGMLHGMTGRAGIRGTATRTLITSAIGAGAGGALGYHHVDKKRDAIERSFGKVDPFELQKLSHLQDMYAAGVEFAIKVASGEIVLE
jgi:hypothetical protein